MTDSAASEAAGRPPTIGQRLLSPIAEVRRDEVMSVMLMTLLMLLILGAYYELKTAREVFILSEGGAEVKSYSSAGQAVLLLFLVPAYGAFASRVNRVQLVQWVTAFFVLHIGIFLLALRSGFHIGVAYFLWVGIFNLMVIAQFWAFAAGSLYAGTGQAAVPHHRHRRQSRRLAWIGPRRRPHGPGRPDPAPGRRGGDSPGLRAPRQDRQSRDPEEGSGRRLVSGSATRR